jgi:hypothetical protein
MGHVECLQRGWSRRRIARELGSIESRSAGIGVWQNQPIRPLTRHAQPPQFLCRFSYLCWNLTVEELANDKRPVVDLDTPKGNIWRAGRQKRMGFT